MQRLCTSHIMALIVILCSFQTARAVTLLSEGFEDVPNLAVHHWYTINHSEPAGMTGWFNGDETLFPAQSGAATAYAVANFDNTEGKGTISNWLITPQLNFSIIDRISFYTRTVDKPVSQDRLQVRLSTSGESINVGSSATDVGDFTTMLLDINPELKAGGYPTTWTKYIIQGDELPRSGTGRIAFRYFVTDGGKDGANSDYIGIDTVEIKVNARGSNDPRELLNRPRNY